MSRKQRKRAAAKRRAQAERAKARAADKAAAAGAESTPVETVEPPEPVDATPAESPEEPATELSPTAQRPTSDGVTAVPAPLAVAPAVVPRSMKLALFATAAAALLSTSVALYVALDDDEPAPTQRVATDDVDLPEPTPAPERIEPADSTTPATVAAEPPPAPAAVPWPDLEVDGLPPVGAAPAAMGESLGSPRDGALVAPTRLPNGRHYIILDEQTAWGTSNTIEHLRAAIRKTRKRHPAIARVVVGDLSTQRGGPLSGHTSHQAGRDVDVGLIHRGRPKDAPPEFIEGTHENLDRRATYDLLAALAATRDQPGGVELIVLDYGLQRILRRSATARGVDEAELEALFQFPHGPDSRHGLVRHMPAHRDHLHVRFSCPPEDRYCRSPLLGFAGMDSQ